MPVVNPFEPFDIMPAMVALDELVELRFRLVAVPVAPRLIGPVMVRPVLPAMLRSAFKIMLLNPLRLKEEPSWKNPPPLMVTVPTPKLDPVALRMMEPEVRIVPPLYVLPELPKYICVPA